MSEQNEVVPDVTSLTETVQPTVVDNAAGGPPTEIPVVEHNSDFITKLSTLYDKAENYAFEIFLASGFLALVLFIVLLPKIAFVALVALAGASGWIAYLGLKAKGKL